MEARWELFRANVHRLEIFEDVLQEQDRMLRIKLEANEAFRCELAQEDELHELQREEIGTKLANIAKKKEAVMRGEPVDVDEDDPLHFPEPKRRRTKFDLSDEPEEQSADHDSGPPHAVMEDGVSGEMIDANSIQSASGLAKGKPFGHHLADVEHIHDKFPTVVRLDGVWVDVSCAQCGANGSKKKLYKSLLSFRIHHTKMHPLVHFKGLGFCERRVVSDTDVQNMKDGREPEVPIVKTLGVRSQT
ncbi:hypothetical protein BST61_g2883 [Cercospora zeina]